jgi:autotransporter-associated beta strand protein
MLAVNAGGTGEWSSVTTNTAGALGGLIAGTGGQGAPVSWTSGSVLGIDTTNASGGNFTYGGVIGSFATGGNSVGLTKLGTGTLTLTGNNTYSGGTTVTAGTLLANNATSSTGTGAVVVNNSGTLGGTGKITGSVTLNNSAVITGATVGTVGTLNTGALTLNNTSILSVDMTSTTADQINVTGAVALVGAGVVLQLNIPNGTLFAVGQQFTLINNDLADAISGTFSNAPTGMDIINGYAWTVTYAGGTNSNDFVLTAVPEPSTWLAGALALVAVSYMQRRRLVRVISRRR